MNQFTPEQAVRWDAWQAANVISARRSDHIARLVGILMLAAAFTGIVVALLQ